MLIFLVLIETLIGVLAIAYGLFTLIMKRVNKEKFLLTLTLTNWIFGEKWGRPIHHIFFTIVPFLVGVWLLINIYIIL